MSQPSSSSSLSAQDLPSSNTLRTVYADKQMGELFEFGRYPQGADGEIEPITWRVLQRDADHLFAIAEQGLDCKPYNDERISIDWAGCTLRRWLNFEFYDMAFNEQERQCILETSIANNVGPDTDDCVFLLSVDEAKRLFANVGARRAKPTEYANINGVDTDDGYCWWWLRSRGSVGSYAAGVFTVGSVLVGGYRVDYDGRAVRPALKLAL